MSLTAGGHPVHRLRPRPTVPAEEQPDKKAATVPLVERYNDLARFMHRTIGVPRGEQILVGCTCGFFTLVREGGQLKAGIVSAEHLMQQAEEMMKTIEPRPIGDDE